MKKLIFISTLGFMLSTSVWAAPTEPKSFSPGIAKEYKIEGGLSVDKNTHWFVFDVTNPATETNFTFNLLSGGVDLTATIFKGNTTTFDYAKFQTDANFVEYFPTSAGTYNAGLEDPAFFDDHLDDNFVYRTEPFISEKFNKGTYSLALSSTTKGAATYTMITNAIPLSPVPEPESYAMMIAGLSVVGLMMRRKAKTADDVIATPFTCTTA